MGDLKRKQFEMQRRAIGRMRREIAAQRRLLSSASDLFDGLAAGAMQEGDNECGYCGPHQPGRDPHTGSCVVLAMMAWQSARAALNGEEEAISALVSLREQLARMTQERYEARDLAIRRGEIRVRLQVEINKARSRIEALEDVLWTHWNCTACDDNCRACEIAIRAALAPTKPAAAPKEET